MIGLAVVMGLCVAGNCQVHAVMQWDQLKAVGEPGKHLIRAGEAVTEATYQGVMVEVQPTDRYDNEWLIMTSHDTEFKHPEMIQHALTQHDSGRSCHLMTALSFDGLGGNRFWHKGMIVPVPELVRDQAQLSRADNHLNRHLVLDMTEELDRFRDLQLLPAAKAMMTHQLVVGLCEDDGACPAEPSAAGGEGVYSPNRIEAEAEKAGKSSANLAQLEGLAVFAITTCSMVKLLFPFARRQVELWWAGRRRTESRYQGREEHEMRESLRRRRAAREEEEAEEEV